MKGVYISYSAAERAWLRANRGMVISDYHREFCAQFGRDVSADNLHALRKREGWRTGRTGCVEKGQAPAKKGTKCEPGKGGLHPNARRTQFTPGERRGVAVKLYKPIGTERVSKDGYLERKIHDGMPLQSRWRAVHLIRWEAANGPLPKGSCLKCLDGNKGNTDPQNWEAIPRALLPRLAGGNRYKRTLAYDHAPPELRPSILAIAKLAHQARTTRRRDRDGGSAGDAESGSSAKQRQPGPCEDTASPNPSSSPSHTMRKRK